MIYDTGSGTPMNHTEHDLSLNLFESHLHQLAQLGGGNCVLENVWNFLITV